MLLGLLLQHMCGNSSGSSNEGSRLVIGLIISCWRKLTMKVEDGS